MDDMLDADNMYTATKTTQNTVLDLHKNSDMFMLHSIKHFMCLVIQTRNKPSIALPLYVPKGFGSQLFHPQKDFHR